MSTELVQTTGNVPGNVVPIARQAPARQFIQPTTFGEVIQMSEFLARSGLVGSALRGKPADIAVILMKGSELNVPPMTALAQINVIEGKPACTPELMRALAVRAGHRITFDELSSTTVKVTGTRGDSGEKLTVTWDMDRARAANLAGKGTWKAYPQSMLVARATSELVRYHFPELGIGYVPEELGAEVNEDGELVTHPSQFDTAPPAMPRDPVAEIREEHKRNVAEFLEMVKAQGLGEALKEWSATQGFESWKPQNVTPAQLVSAIRWLNSPAEDLPDETPDYDRDPVPVTAASYVDPLGPEDPF